MIRTMLFASALCIPPAAMTHAAAPDPVVIAAPVSLKQAEGPNVGRAGALQFIQLWSLDPEAFLAEWNRPTPPHLVNSRRTVRNRAIQQFIIFGGCSPDPSDNCRLSARVTISDPDGEPYGDAMSFPVWDNLPAPEHGRLVLSPNSIGLIIENGEKLGTYRVTLSITDENAGVTAEAVSEIEVSEAEAPAD